MCFHLFKVVLKAAIVRADIAFASRQNPFTISFSIGCLGGYQYDTRHGGKSYATDYPLGRVGVFSTFGEMCNPQNGALHISGHIHQRLHGTPNLGIFVTVARHGANNRVKN